MKAKETESRLDPIFRKIIGNVHITAIIDSRKKAVGQYYIAIRVSQNRQMFYYRTGLKLPTEEEYRLKEYNGIIATKNNGTRRGANYEKLKSCEKTFDLIAGKVQELINADTFTFSALRDSLNIKKSTDNTPIKLSTAWMEVAEDRNKHNTKESYKYALRSFESAVGENITFTNLSKDHFSKWRKKMGSEKKSSATIGMYERAAKVVLNVCLRKGYIKENQYPYNRTKENTEGLTPPKGEARYNNFICVKEILKLSDFSTTCSERGISEAIDMFLTAYLCNGCNTIDLLNLKWDKSYFQNEENTLTFIRAKTKGRHKGTGDTPVIIPIIPELRQLLKKRASTPKEGEFLFPHLSDCSGNIDITKRVAQLNNYWTKKLKAACTLLEIKKPVTMEFARHSFKTNLTHAGIDHIYSELAMGHRRQGVEGSYTGLYSLKKMMRFNSMLLTPEDEE